MKSEKAVNTLTELMETYQLSEKDLLLARAARALSIKKINFVRLHSGEKVDTSQAEQAIEDLDFVIRKDPGGDTKGLMYTAGHIAIHLLKHPVLAYKYWEKCAPLEHAGCMNIMASHRFTGENGLSIDINASILWHKRTYNTGTSYLCSGVFSASTLAEMAYHFPEVATGATWEQWLSRRDQLNQKVEDIKQEKGLCHLGLNFAMSHVLFFGKGIQNSKYIDLAIESATDENHKQVFQLLRSASYDVSDVIKYIGLIDYEPDQCGVSLIMLLHAKYSGNYKASKQLENYLTTLNREHCAWQHALIQNLKNEGLWDKEP
ncbi:hypothetical protein J8M20_09120 [Pseudoalteromonas luteoviolacea]|uniref:hypothetical protein n=1 Tax=Pseudoalteromonas luteoviolacea TaxID=43657 RepID=UPI001B395808|nr:hypothetical protein [Pseudoalteromonas luteoviolacea]MBQ4811498.1 hypothetical protein [Pseudoalteromonas luteoviolacea]